MNNNIQIGLPGMTFLVLLVLKLTGYIEWSWLLVTLPLWFWIPLIITMIFIVGLLEIIRGFIDNRKK
jgi:hypothetical protein